MRQEHSTFWNAVLILFTKADLCTSNISCLLIIGSFEMEYFGMLSICITGLVYVFY